MKNLDLATLGVEEMNEVQMQGVDGGVAPLAILAIIGVLWIADAFID